MGIWIDLGVSIVMGVPQARWMVMNGKILLKDDLGVLPLQDPPHLDGFG